MKQFGDPKELRDWLLTPVVPGGPSPLDLLREEQNDAFDGLLLQAKTATLPHLFVPFPTTPSEVTVRRMRKLPRIEDDEP